MRTAGAVLVAFGLFFLEWVIMFFLLVWIGRLAAASDHVAALPAVLHVGAMYFLAPAIAGYVAIGATPSVMRRVDARTLFTAFTASVVTLGILGAVLIIMLAVKGKGTWGAVAIQIGQIASIVVGARVGLAWAATPTESRGGL